ncbi:cobalt-precorrin 5A hydrolase [Bacillus alkalicellulosilyticus]|uniref:cobalt-precorrin 5A hydrolase n=1 Tax=Alkalihalobacterium alkalicellulosilyticum TaxID=1912214 RepID=UPI000996EF10|nr:cobalamin biosynthesis protein [Bacillus alkalicellulosilyticus]
MENVALVAITKHGVELIRNLQQDMPKASLHYMSKFEVGDEADRNIQTFEGSVRLLLPELFQQYDGIVMVISLGAVVRMIAPILKDKKTDPAVVVIDDKGQFVISVLSGHIGGANELTKQLAFYLDAIPVITTASDVQKTIPVDIFGRELGWTVEDYTYVTPVSAAVVNEEPVAIIQESGESNWWKHKKPLPRHMNVFSSLQEGLQEPFSAALVITHRDLSVDEKKQLEGKAVLYRPKSIMIGMGCNRGTSAEEIEEVITSTLQELQFSISSVSGIATIDLKKDESGLLEVVNKYNWEFICYSADELNHVPIKNPSNTVFKYTGAYGVSEPAAMLAAGTDTLVLEKRKSGNVTISIAIKKG